MLYYFALHVGLRATTNSGLIANTKESRNYRLLLATRSSQPDEGTTRSSQPDEATTRSSQGLQMQGLQEVVSQMKGLR